MTLPDWSAAKMAAAAPVLDEWIGIYNLPASLAYALVSQESRFTPTAYRAEPQINDASYGLTQILYRTAQGLGYSGTPDGLFDPEVNVQLGLLYLRNKLDRYGDVAQALSAYNSGHPTGSTAGNAYASQVLQRADYFDRLFASQPVDQQQPTGDVALGEDIVVNDDGTGTAGSVSVALLVAVAIGLGLILWRGKL